MSNFSPCCDSITDQRNLRGEGFNLVHGSKAPSTELGSHGDSSTMLHLATSHPQTMVQGNWLQAELNFSTLLHSSGPHTYCCPQWSGPSHINRKSRKCQQSERGFFSVEIPFSQVTLV